MDKQAGVAQLVEHLICNQRVGGSNPSASSIHSHTQNLPRHFGSSWDFAFGRTSLGKLARWTFALISAQFRAIHRSVEPPKYFFNATLSAPVTLLIIRLLTRQ